MRTTLNLNDALLEEARRITGIHEKTALVHRGLKELVARGKRTRPKLILVAPPRSFAGSLADVSPRLLTANG